MTQGSRARPGFREELDGLKDEVIGGLDLVVSQLDRALDAITYQNPELARMVTTGDRRLDELYVEVHQRVLALLGRQALFAADLRLAGALLHTIRCVERMGDQCANMAKLVPLSRDEVPKDIEVLTLIETTGVSVRQQIIQCRNAFRDPDARLAADIAAEDSEVNRMNRAVFQRAVEVGDDPELREWAMFMVLIARCQERISGNTVDIAEQAMFVKTGIYKGLSADEPPAPS